MYETYCDILVQELFDNQHIKTDKTNLNSLFNVLNICRGKIYVQKISSAFTAHQQNILDVYEDADHKSDI